MRIALTLATLFLATPSLAGTFSAPEGCALKLTVQSRGCSVSHFYTCEKDPKGNQWRADFGYEGQVYLSMIDSETQWVESYDIDPMGANPPARETLDPDPRDPASLSELVDTGLDSFDFNLTKDSGEQTRVVGFDKLTGKNAVIDGVTLKQTEYEYTQTDMAGTVLRHSKGREYISEEFRSFFSGHSEWDAEDGSTIMIEGAPISFILPGEPGFASTTPLFECDAQMSSFTPQISPVPKDPDHDDL
jgi:hypothetical protein